MHTLYGLENAAADEQVFGRVEWVSGVLQRLPTSVLQSVVREERPPATSEAAGNVSERKVMTIDIQPGDTFTINKGGQPYQWRNGKFRSLFSSDWHTGGSGIDHNGLSRDTFAAIAGWAGHTITEATPAPTPVPWPTHVVVSKVNGLVNFRGTHDQCLQFVGGLPVEHDIRPLAPAPLSPKMRAFIEAVANDYNVNIRTKTAAANLLAEGGAA
jgi:hypothetical protein